MQLTTKVEVKQLTKIFGKRIPKAKELLKEHKSKAEILEATGATVGVDQANFKVNAGEILSSWVYLEAGNPPSSG